VLALRELQSAFRRAVLEGDSSAIAPLVVEDGVFADERIAIHRSNVLASIAAALGEVYPAVARLVGERFFDHAAHEFLSAHPPRNPRLDGYGAEFADFLAGFAPGRALVYLADVARLEWRLHAAAMAPEVASLTPDRFAGLKPSEMPALVFRLKPWLGYLSSPWPVDRIWRVSRPGSTSDERVNIDQGGVNLEIGRRGDEVIFRALPPGAFAFRAALAGSATLEGAAEAALAADSAFQFARAFADLFREGLPIAILGRDAD
jgi:hypothetical protein